jgi:hypothetical protein
MENLANQMKQNLQEPNIELRIPKENDMQFIRNLWSDPETMKPVGDPILLTDDRLNNDFEK